MLATLDKKAWSQIYSRPSDLVFCFGTLGSDAVRVSADAYETCAARTESESVRTLRNRSAVQQAIQGVITKCHYVSLAIDRNKSRSLRTTTRTPTPSESFVTRARHLESKGRLGAALDLVYDASDEMMRGGEFAKLDQIIAATVPAELSIDMILGVLTATLPARDRLPARSRFFAQTSGIILTRGEDPKLLLAGLE